MASPLTEYPKPKLVLLTSPLSPTHPLWPGLINSVLPYFLHLSPPSTYSRQLLILFFQHLYHSLLLQSPSILDDASAACHQSGFPKTQISLWYFLNIPGLFDTHKLPWSGMPSTCSLWSSPWGGLSHSLISVTSHPDLSRMIPVQLVTSTYLLRVTLWSFSNSVSVHVC